MDQQLRQSLSLDLEKNDCLQMMNILGTYSKTKGEAWDSWASQINKIIQSVLDKSPSTQIVKITLDDQNWISIKKIIQSVCKDLGEEQVQWYKKINQIISDASQIALVSPPISDTKALKSNNPQEDGKITVKPINANIHLQKGEFCYFMERVDLYEEKKVTKSISFHGPTLRLKIVPGMYYRAGNFNIGRKTENEFIKIDNGILYITSERLIFTGSINNKTIKYAKIIKLGYQKGKGIEIIKDSGNSLYFIFKNNLLFAAQLIQHFIKSEESSQG